MITKQVQITNQSSILLKKIDDVGRAIGQYHNQISVIFCSNSIPCSLTFIMMVILLQFMTLILMEILN